MLQGAGIKMGLKYLRRWDNLREVNSRTKLILRETLVEHLREALLYLYSKIITLKTHNRSCDIQVMSNDNIHLLRVNNDNINITLCNIQTRHVWPKNPE